MCGQIQTLKSHPKQARPRPHTRNSTHAGRPRADSVRELRSAEGENKRRTERRATPNPGTPTPLNKQNRLGLWLDSTAVRDRPRATAGQ